VLRILSVFVNYQVTFSQCFLYQFVEFVGRVFDQHDELLAVRKECTLSEYSFEFIITIILSLYACIIIAFSVVNLFSSFIKCICLVSNTLVWPFFVDDMF